MIRPPELQTSEEKIACCIDSLVSRILESTDDKIKETSAEMQKASGDAVSQIIAKEKEETDKRITELVKNVADFHVKTTCEIYKEQIKHRRTITISLIISVAALLLVTLQYFLI